MSESLEKLSVIELRQKAKEMGVKLGAGINKQGIIEKLQATMPAEEASPAAEEAVPAQPAEPAPRPFRSASIITDDEPEEDDDDGQSLARTPLTPARTAVPRKPAAPAQTGSSLTNISAKAPAFTMEGSRAWHNPRTFQGNTYSQNQGWNTRPAQAGTEQRGYGSRPAPSPRTDGPMAQSRPSQPVYPTRFGPDQGTQETAPRPAEYRQSNYQPPQQEYSRQDYSPRDRYAAPQPGGFNPPQRESAPSSSIADILAAGECGDGEGVLEMHPDGYGFLRASTYLPGKQDVYISNAQVRRFNLRSGDYVTGKTRPQRDADRYSAMLYITEINGRTPEEYPNRPRFDELTAAYPRKRITLAGRKESEPVLRLIDLICPLGYGQRALLTVPSRAGKAALLRSVAAAIQRSHPKTHVILLLVDERPEEVAVIREDFKCEVISSTFDESPENQARICDLALERAQRLAEQKTDVVILLDSLTRLARLCGPMPPQGGRAMMSGAARPRKVFGAARNTSEAGTLTVLAVAETGTARNDDLCESFRAACNAEWALLPGGRNGFPLLDIQKSGTLHDEWLLSDQERALAEKLRTQAAGQDAAKAFRRVIALMEKTESNEELAEKFDQLTTE